MGYRLAPLFVLRMAGVPFEALDRLATPEAVAGARRVRAGEDELDRLAEAALASLRKPAAALPAKEVDRARRALGQRHKIPKDAAALTDEVVRYAARFAELEALRTEVAAVLERELAQAGHVLAEAAAGPLRRYSVFSASASVGERLDGAGERERTARGWRERAEDRLHLNYLQRVCAKNDTISEFGPTGWGRLDPDARGIALAPVPGIARRDVFLEKWVTTELCAAMTEDPAARLEAIPRVNPLGRSEGERFVREDLGEDRMLADEERALLAKIDGRTAAHALGDVAVLERLVADGVILWSFEAPALDSHRVQALLSDVRAWREGPARAKWLPIVERLAGAPAQFADADVDGRRAVLSATEAQIAELGRATKERGRALYAAANAIGEDCVRDCRYTLGADVAAQFVADAGPWLDLFRDTTAHAWRHVTTRLRELHATAPRNAGRLSLLAFLRHADAAGTPLRGDGVAKLANAAFREVQVAFEEHLGARADEPEIELSREDCHFVRRRFETPAPPVWPSVDLQISAASTAAVAAGDYQLVIGEVNTLCPTVAHVFFWGCPDRAALSSELRHLIGERRACHVDLRVLDRGNHVAFHWPDVFGDDWTAIVPERVGAGRRTVAPADASVVERDGELRVHGPNGDDLGPLVGVWDMPFALGVHPFVFRRAGHLARLRAGRTILQRRTWTITGAELTGGPFSGTSPALIGAIDRLRARRGLPRHVFVRPSDRVLTERVSASARDKDIKPFYIDLESYLFCEVFAQRLAKYGELEVVEMLPAPDQLLWQEADGRRTFEMRILVGPA